MIKKTPTSPYTPANTHFTKKDIRKFVEAPAIVDTGQSCSNKDNGLVNRLNLLEEVSLIKKTETEKVRKLPKLTGDILKLAEEEPLGHDVEVDLAGKNAALLFLRETFKFFEPFQTASDCLKLLETASDCLKLFETA